MNKKNALILLLLGTFLVCMVWSGVRGFENTNTAEFKLLLMIASLYMTLGFLHRAELHNKIIMVIVCCYGCRQKCKAKDKKR